MQRPTLLRAPRMDAQSGVWLEAFSKRDAQAAFIVAPWALVVGSLAFFSSLFCLQEYWSSSRAVVQDVEAVSHLAVALVCTLYLVMALLCERPWCKCQRGGPRRSAEGWLALLPLALCACCSLGFAHGRHSLLEKGSGRTPIIHGDFCFRAAASGEFLLQVVWLWAADRLRHEGQELPVCKRWFYYVLLVVWCFTFWGPRTTDKPPQPSDHYMVLFGYSARICVFVYCLAQVCVHRARQCCCGCLQDWRVLDNLPCTPGRQRLRYLTYYVLTRPPFLLLVNIPLGYPVAVCAPFASVVRCGFALFLALVLRPAPQEAVGEHWLEAETRQRFDVALARRLWEYSFEAYEGPPLPQVVTLQGCSRPALNGQYFIDTRKQTSAGVYSKILVVSPPCPGLRDEGSIDDSMDMSSRAFLRRTPSGEWEISPSLTFKAGVRWAFVKDAASAPHEIQGLWFELQDAEKPSSNTALQVSLEQEGSAVSSHRFRQHGHCMDTDAHWLIAEELGSLPALARRGEATEADHLPGVAGGAGEVSIIVAFRGTNSFQNIITDARIAMQPLASRPDSDPAHGGSGVSGGAAHAGGENDGPRSETASSWSWRPRLPQWVGARRSLQPVGSSAVPFDLESQVGEELQRMGSRYSSEQSRSVSFGSALGNESGPPATAEPLTAADLETSASDAGCFCQRCLFRLCGIAVCCCLLLLFPFLPPSDFDDDDEEFGDGTLGRVRMHIGFSEAYASVKKDVCALLQQRLECCAAEGRTAHIYVTGHSLGGAMASLFALDLSRPAAQDALELLPLVYTFGSPRLGNAAFRSIYNVRVPNTFRIVASRDLVPTVPPSISYRQIGREVWLDDAGELTFVMSWAMRHLLPPRDSIRYHPMLSYQVLLDKAFQRSRGRAQGSDSREMSTVDES